MCFGFSNGQLCEVYKFFDEIKHADALRHVDAIMSWWFVKL